MPWEQLRPVNGRSQSRLHVADYILDAAQDFDHYGEYAADYWTVRVEPGRYPIYALRDCGRPWHSLSCSMPGVIVSGSWWNKLEPGTPRVAHFSPRPYALAEAILAGTAIRYELRPGVEAKRVGESHGLFYKGERL